jgi:hypothetical protein
MSSSWGRTSTDGMYLQERYVGPVTVMIVIVIVRTFFLFFQTNTNIGIGIGIGIVAFVDTTTIITFLFRGGVVLSETTHDQVHADDRSSFFFVFLGTASYIMYPLVYGCYLCGRRPSEEFTMDK